MAHQTTALVKKKPAAPLTRIVKASLAKKKAGAGKPKTAMAPRTVPSSSSLARSRLAQKVLTKTKYVFNAAKAPIGHVALDEGTRMGAHGAAYLLDVAIPWRALHGWLRPSTLLTGSMFGIAALVGKSNGGKWRALFRNLGQGGLHHLEARALDIVHHMLAPAAASGMAGTEAPPGSSY